jgi:hypothetical protein
MASAQAREPFPRTEEQLKAAGAVEAPKGSNGHGHEAKLPDGSVISVHWPAALCRTGSGPCNPICEPAVYSLTRTGKGVPSWSKSYVQRRPGGRKAAACDARVWGYEITSRLLPSADDLPIARMYVMPGGREIVLAPRGKALVRIDAATGNIVGARPPATVVMDSSKLIDVKTDLKEAIEADLRAWARDTGMSTLSQEADRLRTQALFDDLDKAVFGK